MVLCLVFRSVVEDEGNARGERRGRWNSNYYWSPQVELILATVIAEQSSVI
ncbi:hypothetical protein Sjap_001474 [Stephania japonica]|uniref:Uncharacterized protein n=1 Tax=Stephania japonica TaxID=461633 RepID=A0AAP0KLR9_9MAGN